MMNLTKATYLILLGCIGCGIPPSQTHIEYVDEPFLTIFEQEAYSPNGEIVYQLFHKYGFTDKVAHINVVLQHDSIIRLEHQLPINEDSLKRNYGIRYERFMNQDSISLSWIYDIHSDISLEAICYNKHDMKVIPISNNGSYSVERKKGYEILRIFDNEGKRQFIEVLKN